MAAVGEVLAGRYRLDALLGAGGMATVYRARDLRLLREVAVKVLAPNLAADPVVAGRFAAEARHMALLTHPAVVAVHDVGEARGEPFFVMELVDGESLEARLAREGVLPAPELVAIVASVAEGLAALHERGFVHRDVKPHNILLPRTGRARLADFGLVRGEASTHLTGAGLAVGTLAYMAPELLRGEGASPASDVYALAAVAYRGLTGSLPYPATTLADLVAAQRDLPRPASTVRRELGRRFDDPLMTALGPAGRRPTALAFADRLSAASAAAAAAVGRPDPASVPLAAVDPDASTAIHTAARADLSPRPVAYPGAGPAVGRGTRQATHRTTPGTGTPGRRPRRADASGALPPRSPGRSVLLAGLTALALLFVAVILAAPGLLGGPSASPTARGEAATTDRPRRTRPPASAGATAVAPSIAIVPVGPTEAPAIPTAPPTEPPAQPTVPPAVPTEATGEAARQAVGEALDRYQTALDGATGGDDGDFDADGLRQTVADIRAALDARDDDRARAAAEDLVERTAEAVEDDVDDEVADRLRTRAGAVRDAASALPPGSSGPG